MYKTKRFLTALAAIFMLATGASAQTDTNTIDVTLNPYVKGSKQYTATFQMPDDQGVTLEVEYEKIPEAVLVSPEVAAYGTLKVLDKNQTDITDNLRQEIVDLSGEQLTLSLQPNPVASIYKLATVSVGDATADHDDYTPLTISYDMTEGIYSAPFTMGSTQMGTFFAPARLKTISITPTNEWATWVVPAGYNFTVPENVLCTVSETNGAEAVANALATTKAVPAGTPLLVNGTGEITLTESRATKADDIYTAEEIGTNLLKAGDGTTEWTLAQNVYGLYNGQFYLLEGKVATGKALSLIHISEPTRPY